MYPSSVYRARLSKPGYDEFTANQAAVYGDHLEGHRSQPGADQEEEDTAGLHHHIG